jgi:hypothetical protein
MDAIELARQAAAVEKKIARMRNRQTIARNFGLAARLYLLAIDALPDILSATLKKLRTAWDRAARHCETMEVMAHQGRLS